MYTFAAGIDLVNRHLRATMPHYHWVVFYITQLLMVWITTTVAFVKKFPKDLLRRTISTDPSGDVDRAIASDNYGNTLSSSTSSLSFDTAHLCDQPLASLSDINIRDFMMNAGATAV